MRKIAVLTLTATLALPLVACTKDQRDAIEAVDDLQDVAEDLEDGEINGVNLEELSQQVEDLQTAEYEVTYAQTDSGGEESTLHITQKPGEDDGTVMVRVEEEQETITTLYIDNLESTFTCDKGPDQSNFVCTESDSFGLGAAAASIGTGYYGIFLAFPLVLAAAPLGGYDVQQSEESFAGEQASCWTVVPPETEDTDEIKICLLDSNGLLAYFDDSTTTLSLEEYSDSVSESSFEPPAGAEIN